MTKPLWLDKALLLALYDDVWWRQVARQVFATRGCWNQRWPAR